MKIFSWMRSKQNGRQTSHKSANSSSPPTATYHLQVQESCKEESSHWPNGLLSIGTFGNTNLKDIKKANVEINTPEEEGEHNRELKLLLQTEEFFDCLQCLEDERPNGDYGLVQGNISSAAHSKGGIRKKSLSFLLSKLFINSGRSKLTPLPRDTIPELKVEKSMMDKILRLMVRKKIHPQGSKRKGPVKKCLNDNKHVHESDSEDAMLEKTSNGSKWVKTDSDFIVLEI